MANCNYINYFFYSTNKKLRIGFLSQAGRNNTGKITVHHRSSGHKKSSYRIDFFKRINCFGYVLKIIKTSFFSSFVGLVFYENGVSSYMLLSEDQKINNYFYSGDVPVNKDVRAGYCIPLKYMALFNLVNNLELYPYTGSKLLRAAGCSGLLTSKVGDNVIIKLKSGWNLLFSSNCMANSGIGSNSEHRFFNLKKAGISRALGIRPTVRGVVMNPCDHPHGGGEGKKSGSRAARSPWGWLTKGTPTKKSKKFLLKKKLYKKIV